MRAREAPEVKLENQLKQERSIKRQRSIDLRDEDVEDVEDDEDDVTIVSINPATRGKRTKLGRSPDVEILDLTGDQVFYPSDMRMNVLIDFARESAGALFDTVWMHQFLWRACYTSCVDL